MEKNMQFRIVPFAQVGQELSDNHSKNTRSLQAARDDCIRELGIKKEGTLTAATNKLLNDERFAKIFLWSCLTATTVSGAGLVAISANWIACVACPPLAPILLGISIVSAAGFTYFAFRMQFLARQDVTIYGLQKCYTKPYCDSIVCEFWQDIRARFGDHPQDVQKYVDELQALLTNWNNGAIAPEEFHERLFRLLTTLSHAHFELAHTEMGNAFYAEQARLQELFSMYGNQPISTHFYSVVLPFLGNLVERTRWANMHMARSDEEYNARQRAEYEAQMGAYRRNAEINREYYRLQSELSSLEHDRFFLRGSGNAWFDIARIGLVEYQIARVRSKLIEIGAPVPNPRPIEPQPRRTPQHPVKDLESLVSTIHNCRYKVDIAYHEKGIIELIRECDSASAITMERIIQS
ncbi:MAG: hypothetical protein LBC42_03405, partial [Puniceicoccales bacterium]|nr:hypothetical protein [Puniceicoccales bacterium]